MCVSLINMLKQTLYSALSILKRRASPEGYRLLRVISSYLQLDSWIGLDVHTESTLAAIEAELLVFDAELKVEFWLVTSFTHSKAFPGLYCLCYSI
jgi:hypothetical protein